MGVRVAQWWEHSPPTNVAGFESRRRRHMWVEFVVGSLPCSERFFSGYSGFPLSSKINISKFQFDQESGRRRTTMWMCYLQIVIYLFILFYFINEWDKTLVRSGRKIMLPFQVTSSFRCDFILRCFRHRLVIQSYHYQSNHTQIVQDRTKNARY